MPIDKRCNALRLVSTACGRFGGKKRKIPGRGSMRIVDGPSYRIKSPESGGTVT
jgi:hypothetical protein